MFVILWLFRIRCIQGIIAILYINIYSKLTTGIYIKLYVLYVYAYMYRYYKYIYLIYMRSSISYSSSYLDYFTNYKMRSIISISNSSYLSCDFIWIISNTHNHSIIHVNVKQLNFIHTVLQYKNVKMCIETMSKSFIPLY